VAAQQPDRQFDNVVAIDLSLLRHIRGSTCRMGRQGPGSGAEADRRDERADNRSPTSRARAAPNEASDREGTPRPKPGSADRIAGCGRSCEPAGYG
jgi:hypothetical protein